MQGIEVFLDGNISLVYDIPRKRKDGRKRGTFAESLDRLREMDYREGEGDGNHGRTDFFIRETYQRAETGGYFLSAGLSNIPCMYAFVCST